MVFVGGGASAQFTDILGVFDQFFVLLPVGVMIMEVDEITQMFVMPRMGHGGLMHRDPFPFLTVLPASVVQ